MNYYYDVLLNFQEKYYMFYEWDESDNIEYVKKIPIYHIDNKTYLDLLSNTIKVDYNFLKEIENKTKLKQNNYLKYTCVFSDGKNSLALEFNDDGKSINKSSLILDDELNINEFMYNLNNRIINYEIIDKDEISCETRQEIKVKKLLKLEIETMYKIKDYSKLKYIYLEWFNELKEDIDNMYITMLDKLKENLTDKEYEIYEIIKLSYNTYKI